MKPSRRKIRRHRKYYRMMKLITKNIAKSPAFRRAMCELIIFGRSEQLITIEEARRMAGR